MGHPDFRVGGRVFATLGYPDSGWAMVMLTPEQQAVVTESEPAVFVPVKGGWGRRGATNVRLAAADGATLSSALTMAWRNAAPPRVAQGAAGGAHAAFERVRACAAAAGIPGLAVATSYGTPSLKVARKFLLRIKDADTLVLRCALEDKEMLIAAAPRIYFETDHYKGWPAILVRLSRIGDAELRLRLRTAFLLVAPKRLGATLAPAAPRQKARRPSAATRP
jgi:hypothetical protein